MSQYALLLDINPSRSFFSGTGECDSVKGSWIQDVTIPQDIPRAQSTLSFLLQNSFIWRALWMVENRPLANPTLSHGYSSYSFRPRCSFNSVLEQIAMDRKLP
nr:hypothetical protein BgiMline_025056 [Biomphalaria glabrata]